MPHNIESMHTSFTEHDIRVIRKRAAEGETYRVLARQYRVGLNTIAKVVRRETFFWVPDEGPPPLF